MPKQYANVAFKASMNMPARALIYQMSRYKQIMSDDDNDAKKMAAEAGRRLKWVRELTGKSQKQMAVLIGVSQGEWSRWEKGARLQPPDRMAVLCRRLRISMDYIYRGHLVGVHHDLAEELSKRHAGELVLPPMYTGWSMGMDLA